MSASLEKITNNAKKLLVAAGVTTATFTGAHLDKKVSHTMNAGNCCSTGRRMVKTLKDDGAEKININSNEQARVVDLIQLPKENQQGWSNDSNNARTPDEQQVYTVKCRIYEAHEDGSGDIHMAIRDLDYPDSTMEAVILAPRCAGLKQTAFVPMLRKVKSDWNTLYNDKRIWGSDTFEIKGVVFFDKNNNGIGSNSNGVELHPILSIRKL